MGNVSDTLLIGSLDSVAAIVKAQAAVVVPTEDCFTKGTREDNPTDLISRGGAKYWDDTDDNFQGGTKLYYQADPILAFVGLAATAESYGSVDALLIGRLLRLPKCFDDYIYFPKNGSHITQLFSDVALSLGTLVHGGSFVAGVVLPSVVDSAWGVIQVGTGAFGAATWNLTVAVTYVDDTSGNEAIAVTAESAEGTQFDIGARPITALAKSGQKVVGMSSTTGMVAGQTVLVVDPLYATLLSANAAGSQAIVYVDSTEVGAFRPGDAVTVRDGSSNENVTIESIDYELGKITFTTALSNAYTTAANAFVYLQAATGEDLRPGRQEYHVIDSVAANTSITFLENLRHSVYSGAKAIRLIKSITGIVTSSGGTAADDIVAKTVVERVPTQ